MRRASLAVAAVLLILRLGIHPAAASPNPMLHAAGGAVVNAHGDRVLLRCVNLSPWLVPEGYLMAGGSLAALTTSPSQIKERLAAVVGPERAAAFWRQWIEAFVTEADFRRLSAAGFNCVRLPLDANFIASRVDDHRVTFVPDMIRPVDDAVAWGTATGIHVVLDLHDAPGGQNSLSTVSDVPSSDHTPRLWEGPDSADNQRKTALLWRALAARYVHARSVGGYDLLNEPALPRGAPADELTHFYQATIAAVRSADPDHMIVIEGNDYAHDFSALQTLTDGNVLYEFHEYALGNRRWRRPGEGELEPFLQLRRATGRPLWLGEFGENTAAWQARVVGLLAPHDIGWAVWPWKRVALSAENPVIETIAAPSSWRELGGYLVGRWLARKPSPAAAEQAMEDMLVAVRTENCRTDRSLESILAGK